MSVPIQNPDATIALQELYDIVGSLKLSLDQVISPVAIVDDGWRRVTYISFEKAIAASTTAAAFLLHAASPDFAFQLLFAQMKGTGNFTKDSKLNLQPQGASGALSQIKIAQWPLDGVADPEVVTSRELLLGQQLTAPPNMAWEIEHETTGVGETIEYLIVLAQIPRSITPPGP